MQSTSLRKRKKVAPFHFVISHISLYALWILNLVKPWEVLKQWNGPCHCLGPLLWHELGWVFAQLCQGWKSSGHVHKATVSAKVSELFFHTPLATWTHTVLLLTISRWYFSYYAISTLFRQLKLTVLTLSSTATSLHKQLLARAAHSPDHTAFLRCPKLQCTRKK